MQTAWRFQNTLAQDVVKVMPSNLGKIILSGIIDDLELTRRRLDETSLSLTDSKSAITIITIAQEIEMLCKQTLSSNNSVEVEYMLIEAREKLYQIQVLLGSN